MKLACTRHRRGGVLAGCLVVLGVLAVLVIAGGIWVAISWRGWVSGGLVTITESAIKESNIDPQEQEEILVHVRAFADDFKSGDVSFEEFGKVMEELGKSPLFVVGMVNVFEGEYFAESSLTDEQKADARLQFSRLARGLYDRSIDEGAIKDVLEPIEKQEPSNDGFEFDINGTHITAKDPKKCTPEELLAVLELVRAKADEAGVAPEAFEIDLSDEVKKAMDRGRGLLVEEDHDHGDDADHGHTHGEDGSHGDATHDDVTTSEGDGTHDDGTHDDGSHDQPDSGDGG
ncbi:MAG: hypothetical protein KDA28_07145 [Phycisphaerales bacterium]|nr:hypothetical protein [Phycisphaerales bacterium]